MKSMKTKLLSCLLLVAPYVGAWIEILCGRVSCRSIYVAPYVGAWIEIPGEEVVSMLSNVAPYVGAWIEMVIPGDNYASGGSLPTWERGLKFGIFT